MAERDAELLNLGSVPPEDEDEDDAYGAPTKVGEAAYKILARGMASIDGSAPAPPARPTPVVPPSASTRAKAAAVLDPAVADHALPDHADPEADADEGSATVLLSTNEVSATAPVMVVPSNLTTPPPFAALLAPTSPPPAEVAQSASISRAPKEPIPFELPPPRQARNRRREIELGVMSFLVITVPALIYFMLR